MKEFTADEMEQSTPYSESASLFKKTQKRMLKHEATVKVKFEE